MFKLLLQKECVVKSTKIKKHILIKKKYLNKDENIHKSKALKLEGRTNEHKHLQSVRILAYKSLNKFEYQYDKYH